MNAATYFSEEEKNKYRDLRSKDSFAKYNAYGLWNPTGVKIVNKNPNQLNLLSLGDALFRGIHHKVFTRWFTLDPTPTYG